MPPGIRSALARGLVAALLTAVAFALSACSSGTSSGALEHQACAEVHRSLSLYAQAKRDDGADRSQDLSRALTQLRDALAPAAIASAADSDYQALTATLSETSHVPESQLITALSAQCAAVLGSS